uniref:Polynucleotide kinase/phosphorylase n=1 Tax=Serratia phage Spe5P4 TaxID=3159438 RepID=A0AAU7VH59_9CAUD
MRNLKGCKIAVFDMDNCIIDDRHRQHLINMADPLETRYKRYHEAMADDRPFAFGAMLIKHLSERGWMIVINTARPREYENQTRYQLNHIGVRETALVAALMRDKEDFGIPSDKLKPAKLDKFIREHGIEGCEMVTFDDRPDVVESYSAYFGTDSRTNHFLLTGPTMICPVDYYSLLAAHKAFKGEELPKTENAIPADVSLKFDLSLSIYASHKAIDWLQSQFRLFNSNRKAARAWQMSDFPGAEIYNLKRALDKVKADEKFELKIGLGKTTPFIDFDVAKGGDLTKAIDENVKFLSGLLNVPEHLLSGAKVPECTCPITYFSLTSGGSSHGLRYVSSCPIHGELLKTPETANCRCIQEPLKEKPLKQRTAADVLAEMADTFRERNAVYKDNAAKVGEVMAVLFPDGVTLKTAADHKFYHLFELLIVKLTRFTNSGLKHEDSVHDLTVYGAMLEAIGVMNHNIKTGASEDKDD